jgi:hypothetical protein
MTDEQIAALKVGDKIWMQGSKGRRWRDGEIVVEPSIEMTVTRVTPQKFAVDKRSSGSLIDKLPYLRKVYFTQTEADNQRDIAFLRAH